MRSELRQVLLVEDDPMDVELTRSALAAVPLANEIDVVHDGQAALDYLLRRGAYAERGPGNPGVVILDLELPGFDGHEVLAAIRADPRLRAIPVVILTSSRADADLARSYALGTNAFVVKPVRFEEFFEALRRLGLFWAVLNEPPSGEGTT